MHRLFADIFCQKNFLPVTGNVTLSSKLVGCGTIVVAQCGEGLTFTPNYSSVALQCLESAAWNATLQPCQGTLFIHKVTTTVPLFVIVCRKFLRDLGLDPR